MKIMKSLLVALCLAYSSLAFAQNYEEFTVRNVEIELSAGKASDLRSKAVDQASRRAFASLLKDITPNETWPRHSAILEITNFDEVMEKFTIVEEITVPTYRLVLDMAFNEEKVKKMLADLNVPFSEATGGKVLIVPLLEMPDKTYLWERENPWKAALASTSGQATFFQFVLPTGDLEERRTLTPEMARFGAGDVLINMAKQYDAKGAVVAKARVIDDYDGKKLHVENLWYGDSAFAPASISLDLPDTRTFEEVLAEAASLAMQEMADYWKGSELVQVDRPGRVFLRYRPSGPKDLEKLKSVVKNMSVVKNLRLRVLNISDSIFEVDFYGESQNMWEKLRLAGLNVATTNMNMVWKVAFPEEEPLLQKELGDVQ